MLSADTPAEGDRRFVSQESEAQNSARQRLGQKRISATSQLLAARMDRRCSWHKINPVLARRSQRSDWLLKLY
jgi:hypothetical protein